MNKERLYSIILGGLSTEKTERLGNENRQISFRVAKNATKTEIKQAFIMLFFSCAQTWHRLCNHCEARWNWQWGTTKFSFKQWCCCWQSWSWPSSSSRSKERQCKSPYNSLEITHISGWSWRGILEKGGKTNIPTEYCSGTSVMWMYRTKDMPSGLS